MRSGKKVTVIIPTYNERGNIASLIPHIFALNVPNLSVAVVDDNSPDGTAEAVRTLAKRYPVTLFSRLQKDGLGKAYAHAFKKIISAESLPDIIIQMDADLSHDPSAIPKFLETIETCDLVLGSRYIIGGDIKNWDWIRKCISRFGNFYARVVLGVPIRDMTGGFKCWRLDALSALDLDSLSSIGYNFQIEATYRAYRRGCRIREIPITFTERKTGVSKFNFAIMLESFLKVLWLKFTK